MRRRGLDVASGDTSGVARRSAIESRLWDGPISVASNLSLFVA
jgi:hypothetical protein